MRDPIPLYSVLGADKSFPNKVYDYEGIYEDSDYSEVLNIPPSAMSQVMFILT